MTKTLGRMTKAELLAHIAKQDAEIALLRRQEATRMAPRAPRSESMGERARRYCKATGARSVDRETLAAWTG